MAERRSSVMVYVRLPDEAVAVWRPVEAEHVCGDRYRILEQPYDATIERWEFVPGDEVYCQQIQVSAGSILAAVRLASSGAQT